MLQTLLTYTKAGSKMFLEEQNGKKTDFPVLCPAGMDPPQSNVKECTCKYGLSLHKVALKSTVIRDLFCLIS